MKRKYRALRVALSVFTSVLLANCGGGGTNSSISSSVSTKISPVTPATATLKAGDTQQFQVTVTGNSNTAVEWEVNGKNGGDGQIGTISSGGLYTAPATIPQASDFTITAFSLADPAQTATAKVTVNPARPPAVVGVTVSPASATLTPSATQQFTATVSGSTNAAVTWAVDSQDGGNTAVGTISNDGLYTAPAAAGVHTVMATSIADSTKSAKAAVTVNASSVAVVLSPAFPALGVNATQQFSATVSGTTNTTVTWSVDSITGGNSNSGIITNTGLYTAPSIAGAHTVTATSIADSSKSASSSVAVLSLSISPIGATVLPNTTQQFTSVIQGASSTAVTWSVDGVVNGNNTVGTISAAGLYTAPSTAGTHTLTATSVEVPALSANSAVTISSYIPGVVSVLTYHNDDVRDGVNANETVLTLANVNSQQFGKKYAFPVDGQIYAQPLYLPNLTIGGTAHNVVFAATENDTVYAFDADGFSTTPLWQNHLGTAANNTVDPEGISPILGITSTPVIDATSGTMYVVTDTEESSKRVYRLHALDLTTGAEKFGGSVVIDGSVPGTGVDSVNGQITLEKGCYQRAGLALDTVTNAVYIGIGHCVHGWMLAYDKTSLQQIAIMNTTPDGDGGSYWGGGGAPAIDDSTGDLYATTGVDAGDTMSGYNDSVVRLNAADLSVLDYFMPSNEAYLDENDLDLGSGSGIIMPDNSSSTPHEYIGGGKDGRIFVVNRDNMGQFQVTDHVIQEVQTGVQWYDNMFDTPAFWNGFIYYHCENDVLKAYSWDANTGLLSTSSVGQGNVVYGIHGATASISANGLSNGIVWEIESTNQGSGPAILHAYDAMNVANELYNSSQAPSRDTAGTAVKFTVPTVTDGHVFVGTANELDVYGLLLQP